MDKKVPHPLFKLATELGPLLIFFFANAKTNLFIATGVFMVAVLAAMVASYVVTRHIPMMAIVTAVVVFVFGALTLILHDETFIKMKPTVYYLLVAALLAFGLATDRPLLQRVLGSTYPGLDEKGWTKLTRNWALFFAFMACLNEAVWRNSSTSFWIGFKLWGALPLTFLFAAANIPMLLRHGLMKDDAVPAEPGPIE
jgi:intracellular septation protein